MPKRNLVVVTAACLLTVMVWAYRPGHADKANTYELFGPMVDVYEEVQRRYVSDVDPRKLRDGAIEGMLDKLDPFSNYIPAEEVAEFKKNMTGEFGGIGIQVGINNNRLTVISPLEDTPACKAGVMAGDWIKEIDGKPTYDPKPITLQEAVGKLTGKPGTKVSITVVRETDKDLTGHKIELTRAIIKVHSVKGWKRSASDATKWDFLMDEKNKIGYVRLNAFQEDTERELDAAIKALQSQGMKGLIIDLRFNPGGLLKSATDIADRFLKKGVIVSTKGRKSPYQEWTAKEEGTYPDFEMAVLINQYSASASEILSGALKDHHRATIVGVRSFGKGSVQNVIPLEDGKSILKLTTAHYYLPSGRCVHKLENASEWGVDPDREVKMTPVEIEGLLRHRRDSEIIRNGEKPKDEKKEEKPDEAKKDEAKKDEKKAEEFVDKQLEAAHTILIGQIIAAERNAAK